MKYPVVIYCTSDECSFELHIVADGEAEFSLNSDAGRIAKAGTLNVLGFNGFTNITSFKLGDTTTADFHFDKVLYTNVLTKNAKFKRSIGKLKYGDNFSLFDNNVYGELDFFIQLAHAINSFESSFEKNDLDEIASNLLLSILEKKSTSAIELNDWDCFYFAANLKSLIKHVKFSMEKLKKLAIENNCDWFLIRKLSKKIYNCAPQVLIADMKYHEFQLLANKHYTKAELDTHFDEKRRGGLKNFIMRYLRINSDEYDDKFGYR